MTASSEAPGKTAPRNQASEPGPPGVDAVGAETLELFRDNEPYSEFLWESLVALSPHGLSGRVLEVGCGIGNLTRILLRSRRVTYLHAIDLAPSYIQRVREEIADPRLQLTAALAEDFCPAEHATPEGGFDLIVSSNVLEHIEDHARALRNFRSMLRPHGVVLLLVPAHRFLYSSLDRSLSHCRRYSARDLKQVAGETNLTVLRLRYFNPLGAMGWWLNGKLLRRSVLPAGQLSLYTRFAIPVSKLLDRWNPLPFGVSLLAVLGR